MKSKDEILRDLAHDIAAAKVPRNRIELLLAAIIEPLIDIRDIFDNLATLITIVQSGTPRPKEGG